MIPCANQHLGALITRTGLLEIAGLTIENLIISFKEDRVQCPTWDDQLSSLLAFSPESRAKTHLPLPASHIRHLDSDFVIAYCIFDSRLSLQHGNDRPACGNHLLMLAGVFLREEKPEPEFLTRPLDSTARVAHDLYRKKPLRLPVPDTRDTIPASKGL